MSLLTLGWIQATLILVGANNAYKDDQRTYKENHGLGLERIKNKSEVGYSDINLYWLFPIIFNVNTHFNIWILFWYLGTYIVFV